MTYEIDDQEIQKRVMRESREKLLTVQLKQMRESIDRAIRILEATDSTLATIQEERGEA